MSMPQLVKDDTGELWVCVLPFQELFADEHRLHHQTVGESQQHPVVAVPLRVEGFFPFQSFQPLLHFLPQGGGHKDGAAGRENGHHWFLCKPALGGRRLSTATPIRASFCHRTGACRNLSQPLFRISRNQGVTH